MIFPYQDKIYEVEVIKKNNKNTYIRIKEGKIYITTSYYTSKNTITKLLEENKKAIGKMIEKSRLKEKKKNNFYLFGIPYQINIQDKSNFLIDKEKKEITINKESSLEKYLRIKAKEIYSEHLFNYYEKFEENIPKPTLKIRKMKTRWGVCNTKTHMITLNLELIHYEIECLDYVIVHELSHLLVPNHSKNFWNIVSKYYPNYKEIRKKLRNE